MFSSKPQIFHVSRIARKLFEVCVSDFQGCTPAVTCQPHCLVEKTDLAILCHWWCPCFVSPWSVRVTCLRGRRAKLSDISYRKQTLARIEKVLKLSKLYFSGYIAVTIWVAINKCEMFPIKVWSLFLSVKLTVVGRHEDPETILAQWAFKGSWRAGLSLFPSWPVHIFESVNTGCCLF